MNIILGLGIIAVGTWITIAQIKYLGDRKPDLLGNHIKMLGGGIIFIACGIAMIIQNI